ncbi:MAG: (2Fe-2S)-binding protein, partial [Verrucomicrobiales bacterium]|nr:(2Fe-2S)-binding protein [Verrucomicrobiales bacterium]
MVKVTVDGREIEVPRGATLLDAARGLGIDVPTLCHLERC